MVSRREQSNNTALLQKWVWEKWNEIGVFNVTEQRLVDQKNNIVKRKWPSDLELQEIQRNIKDIGHGEVRLESDENEGWFLQFDHEGQDEYLKEYKDVLVDCMVPNVEEEKRSIFLVKMNMQNYKRGDDNTWKNV